MNKKLSEILEEIKIGPDYEFIKLNEDLEEDFEVLEEGIKYFKASQRLKKLAEKLHRKDMKELQPLVERVNKVADEFERIEGKFARGEISKGQARLRIDNIKRNYADIMRILRKKEFGSFLKVSGVATILGGIVASIIFGFQPLQAIGITLPSFEKIKSSLGLLGTEIARQLQALKKAFQKNTPSLIKAPYGSV